jgi:hypothetical protein
MKQKLPAKTGNMPIKWKILKLGRQRALQTKNDAGLQRL